MFLRFFGANSSNSKNNNNHGVAVVKSRSLASLWLWWLLVFHRSSTSSSNTVVSWAWQTCSVEEGGGICPTGNTCCPAGIPGVSTCVSGKNSSTGSCCTDDINLLHVGSKEEASAASSWPSTGCGENYTCAVDDKDDLFFCKLISDHHHHDEDDAAPPRLPRYKLCHVPAKALQHVQAFPILPKYQSYDDGDDGTRHDEDRTEYAVAYYSSIGAPLDLSPPTPTSKPLGDHLHQNAKANDDDDDDDDDDALAAIWDWYAQIHTIVITVHGSTLNADDYLCCTHAALPDPNRTLVLAPWFLPEGNEEEDEEDQTTRTPTTTTTTTTTTSRSNNSTTTVLWLLRWHNKASRETIYPHSYRYGADSIQGRVSSYAILDALLDFIVQRQAHQFPRLKRLVVTGHSAGGQYTQRWALLSNQSLLSSSSSLPSVSPSSSSSNNSLALRVVVANPKSFCYLDERRFWEDSQTWQVPSQDELCSCSLYHKWEWGLGPGNVLPSSYKTAAIATATHGVATIVEQYQYRPVVYLSGHLDVVINGQCMDQWQGMNRRARSRRYYEYLNHVIYNHNNNNTINNNKNNTPSNTRAFWRSPRTDGNTRGAKSPTGLEQKETTTTSNKTLQQRVHRRLEVAQVHHDHCLLYQSPEGQIALFGTDAQILELQQQQEQEQ
ncbi:hypothetical protein ACA910_019340 [Epithemia clementina (nom. ined.)]